MNVFINEIETACAPGTCLDELRQQYKPYADIMIVNGYPALGSLRLESGDRVSLIRRGEIPTTEELEALMTARHTPGVHDKVKNSCVGIAGVGGLGSQIAFALARVGIGSLIIVDFDIVEPSNLNRQQYFNDQVGMAKVAALADNLARINPCTHIEAHQVLITTDNVSEFFSRVDILVEALDSTEKKGMLGGYWLQHYPDKPYVGASGIAGYGPANTISTVKVKNNFYICGDGISAAEPGRGLMAPRVGIVAHHQANAVLRLLLNEDPVGENDYSIE